MYKYTNNMLAAVIAMFCTRNNDMHSRLLQAVTFSEFQKALCISQALMQEYGM